MRKVERELRGDGKVVVDWYSRRVGKRRGREGEREDMEVEKDMIRVYSVSVVIVMLLSNLILYEKFAPNISL